MGTSRCEVLPAYLYLLTLSIYCSATVAFRDFTTLVPEVFFHRKETRQDETEKEAARENLW